MARDAVPGGLLLRHEPSHRRPLVIQDAVGNDALFDQRTVPALLLIYLLADKSSGAAVSRFP
jgi:hypothetical protein